MRHVYPIRHAFSRHLYGYLPERALIKSAENSWYLLGFHVNQLRKLALLVRKRWPTRDSSFCFFFFLFFLTKEQERKKDSWRVSGKLIDSLSSLVILFFLFFFLRWTIFVMEEDDQKCFKILNSIFPTFRSEYPLSQRYRLFYIFFSTLRDIAKRIGMHRTATLSHILI